MRTDTKADKSKRRIRLVIAWGWYVLAGAIAIGFCLWSAINPGLGIVLFMIGYLAGRITKGVER